MNMSMQTGYIELLKTNSAFRRLWLAQLISMAGDWISIVALYGVVFSLSGSGLAASLIIALTLLPYVFLGPFGGVLADRYNRKFIMVFSDIARMFMVLGLLLIHSASQLWLLYLILVVTEIFGVLYYPAAQAAFPSLVEGSELYAANILSGASWGTMMAVGAALGGLISTFLGRNSCFIFDSVSFLISALITIGIKRSFSKPESQEKVSGGWHDLKEGFRYIASEQRIRQLFLFNGCLGIATGIVLLYTIFPVKIFKDGDFGIGVLYSLRGFGNVAGPFLLKFWVGEDLPSIRKGLLQSSFCIGIFYFLFSQSPGLALAGVAVFFAHAGNGAFWVLSNLIFQKYVPNRLLGRVMSLEVAIFTLAMSFSSLACGWLVGQVSPRLLAILFGVIVLVFTAFWGYFTRKSFR